MNKMKRLLMNENILCFKCRLKENYFFDSGGNFLDEMAYDKKLITTNSWASGSMCRYKHILYIWQMIPAKYINFSNKIFFYFFFFF